MEILVEAKGQEIYMSIAGRLTSENVYPLNAEIKKMMEQYGIPITLIIDMKEVIYINASALRALYYLVRFLFHRNAMVYFYGYQGIMHDFVELTGIAYPYPFHIFEQPINKK